jgi:N-acetylmuramoyl-L-alanine amidase
MKPTLEFIASPNYRAGRRKPITALVIHYTASLFIESTINWFTRKESSVSAHYVVGRDGRVVQMVREEDVAWHAGRSAMGPSEKPPREPNVNDFSIGIELVGTMDSGFTDRQLASFYELLAQLVVKYRIMPERVVGHLHVSPGRKIDPDGVDQQFPWSKTRMVAQAAYGRVVREGPVSA